MTVPRWRQVGGIEQPAQRHAHEWPGRPMNRLRSAKARRAGLAPSDAPHPPRAGRAPRDRSAPACRGSADGDAARGRRAGSRRRDGRDRGRRPRRASRRVAREIGCPSCRRGFGVALHRRDDLGRDGAVVQRIRALLGDRAQRGGERGVAQDAAGRGGRCRRHRGNRRAAPGTRRTASSAPPIVRGQARRDRRSPPPRRGWRARSGAAQGSVPCSRCAASSMRSSPGTPTLRPPSTASAKPMGWPSGRRKSPRRGGGGRRLPPVPGLEVASRAATGEHQRRRRRCRWPAARPG